MGNWSLRAQFYEIVVPFLVGCRSGYPGITEVSICTLSVSVKTVAFQGCFCSARGVVGWGAMLQVGRSRVWFPLSLDFSVEPNFYQPHFAPEFYSASNRNEYQECSFVGWGVIVDLCQRLRTSPLWAYCLENVGASTSLNTVRLSMACYKDTFTFHSFLYWK
jgi:hypothetical protein